MGRSSSLSQRRARCCRFEAAEPSRRLTFSPLAWLKLMFFLHAGETEVGGFGQSRPDDPLYVQDFVTVDQRTSAASVEFDDAAVADYFDGCADRGLKPDRFARLWIHTHPAESARPSWTDEETFARVFGACDWSVMFIVSRAQRTYARLSISVGPRAQVPLEVAVDWEAWPQMLAQDHELWSESLMSWAAEYERSIHPRSEGIFDALAATDLPQWCFPDEALDVTPGVPQPSALDAGQPGEHGEVPA